jgi:hypothetical protein
VTTAEYEAELERAKEDLEQQVKRQDDQMKTMAKQVQRLQTDKDELKKDLALI